MSLNDVWTTQTTFSCIELILITINFENEFDFKPLVKKNIFFLGSIQLSIACYRPDLMKTSIFWYRNISYRHTHTHTHRKDILLISLKRWRGVIYSHFDAFNGINRIPFKCYISTHFTYHRKVFWIPKTFAVVSKNRAFQFLFQFQRPDYIGVEQIAEMNRCWVNNMNIFTARECHCVTELSSSSSSDRLVVIGNEYFVTTC